MPPDFNKLPLPTQNKNTDDEKIEKLINKNKSQNSSTNFEVKNKSTESFILKKIKEN